MFGLSLNRHKSPAVSNRPNPNEKISPVASSSSKALKGTCFNYT